jgi:sugar lactone lactonase YvrE
MGRYWAPARSLALALVLVACLVAPADARPDQQIVLPGATSAEGIATGRGSTFYAGDLLAGTIFVGGLQSGSVSVLREPPDGRMAVGMHVDVRHDLLFVAGGLTGQGYVYDTRTGADVAVFTFADPTTATFVNDVVVTRSGAWFTDSAQPRLYRVPIAPGGTLGPVTTLELQGPAADTSAEFNLNGIAATPNGQTLIVAHSGNGRLYGVDPNTGQSWQIAGVSVPSVDGILLEAGRLYAVQNFLNQIAVIKLRPDATSGTMEQIITSPHFQVPTTVARHGNRLAAVNAKFDTGFPPQAEQFEVVVVRR